MILFSSYIQILIQIYQPNKRQLHNFKGKEEGLFEQKVHVITFVWDRRKYPVKLTEGRE